MEKTKRQDSIEGYDDLLASMLQSPLMSHNALDGQIVPIDEPISIVVATRNRCPFPPESPQFAMNPLLVSLQMLLRQQAVNIVELVVVDDCSEDFTQDVLSTLSADLDGMGITLRYTRNKESMGCPWARRIGVDLATAPFVNFVDDDCLFPPYYMYGGLSVLMKPENADVGAVGLPCYYRELKPRRVLPADQIGRLSISDVRWQSNFDAIPEESLLLLDSGRHELPMIPAFDVDWCLSGNSLARRDIVVNSNAFHDYFQEAGWSDSFEFATSLNRAGYRVQFCPDPKFGICHLKFGARGRYDTSPADLATEIPSLGVTLQELIAIAEKERMGTGLRTSLDDFIVLETKGFFAFFVHYSIPAAVRWALQAYRDYVENGIIHHASIATSALPSRQQRYETWREAILSGIDLAGRYFGIPKESIIQDELKSVLRSTKLSV